VLAREKGAEDDRGCASIKRGSGRGGLQTPTLGLQVYFMPVEHM